MTEKCDLVYLQIVIFLTNSPKLLDITFAIILNRNKRKVLTNVRHFLVEKSLQLSEKQTK